jgi:hypothetical protein
MLALAHVTTPQDVHETIGACVLLYREAAAGRGEALAGLAAELATFVPNLWLGLAESFSGLHPQWRPLDDRPGHLCRVVEETMVTVPIHLIDDFPDDRTLSELCALAKAVRCDERSAICISGSAALQRTLHFVADVDFCEYVSDRNFARHRAFARHARSVPPPLACLSLKAECNGVAWKQLRPFDPEEVAADAMAFTWAKCDFVATTVAVGLVEVSNVILVLDPAQPDIGPALRSFAAQEAPFGSWVPRAFAVPLELGRYVQWLLEQVERLGDNHPVKALKRAIALARVLLLAEFADEARDALLEHHATLAAALESRLALREQVVHAGGLEQLARTADMTIVQLRAQLPPELQQLPNEEAIKRCLDTRFRERAVDVCERLTSTVRGIAEGGF